MTEKLSLMRQALGIFFSLLWPYWLLGSLQWVVAQYHSCHFEAYDFYFFFKKKQKNRWEAVTQIYNFMKLVYMEATI